MMSLRLATALLCLLLVTACKHPLAIDGEGDIFDTNGNGFGCSLEEYQSGDQRCTENDVQGDYNVNYVAVPRPGWTFSHWDGSCGHTSTGPYCAYQVSAPIIALWDTQFSHIDIPPLTAVFVPLEEADKGGNYAGHFDMGPYEAVSATPTLSFDVTPGGEVSWWLDLSVYELGAQAAVGPVDEYGQFSISFYDRTLEGAFLDHDHFVGRTLFTETGELDAYFSGSRVDRFPDDPTEDSDSDNDGVGDNSDAFPSDPNEWLDSDGDGAGDNGDAMPHDPTETQDRDFDGVGDNSDAFPDDPHEWTDTDGDGTGDNTDDFPLDPDQVHADAQSYFNSNVADDVLAAQCLFCHFEGGLSGNTRLVFAAEGTLDQDEINLQTISDFIDQVENGGELILTKVRGGAAHGGGSIFSSGSDEFAALNGLISQLDGESGDNNADLSAFWDGVELADSSTTLRRAALILSGKLPEEAEYDTAREDEGGLRRAIRGLMQGEGFHQFLVRAANDRLHTEAFLNGLFNNISDISATAFYPVGSQLSYDLCPKTEDEQDTKWRMETHWQVGITRAPLELIAYVVENDLPYSQILTADHTMVNYMSNNILRSGAEFNSEDPLIFKPGQNRGQVPQDEQLLAEYDFECGTQIFSHGEYFEYPHAGVLNSMAFLSRYPTTETNRNRARARWTYLHFLGVDIEKSAARTTDAEALSDTDNPTLNNPACTVCHQLHDPVAGTFQNYGNEGWFRSSWGGQDALPDTYKYPDWFSEEFVPSPYQEGDTWFRDMRTPGFDGKEAPDPDSSLQWLAQEITNDDRFATATVHFWWQAVMGSEPLEAPESQSDVYFTELLRAYEAQQVEIQTMALLFREGFDGGQPYNLKDLLAAMTLSPWFRAAENADNTQSRQIETLNAGIRRLLTPEELENKTRQVLGYAWDEWPADWDHIDYKSSALMDTYRLYYGGLDSIGIKERARALTTLMANVAELQAMNMACPTVVLDFNRSEEEKILFAGLDRTITPVTELTDSFSVVPDNYAIAEEHTVSGVLEAGTRRVRMAFTNDYYEEDTHADRNLVIDRVELVNGTGNVVASFAGEEFRAQQGFFETTAEWGTAGGEHWNGDTEAEDGWMIWGQGQVSLTMDIPESGHYSIVVVAWAQQAGPDQAMMTVSIEAESPWANSTGEKMIKAKLLELHQLFLGETLSVDDEEITNSYQLLVDTWEERMADPWRDQAWYWEDEQCNIPIEGWWDEDRSAEHTDPHRMMGTWTSILISLMTDFNYLHE